MNATLRLIVAVTAVATSAVACSAAAQTSRSEGGSVATPSPSATSVSTSAASGRPDAPPTPVPGSRDPERHSSVHFSPALHFAAPAGWTTVDDDDGYYVLAMDPGDSGAIVVQADPVIASDERDCEGRAAPGGATTVDGIVAALSTDTRLARNLALPVTIGGHQGRAIDIQLAPDWTRACKWSDGKPAALLLTVASPPGPFFGIAGRERVRLILLDVGNRVVSIGIDSVDGSKFDRLLSQAMPIVETFELAP